MLSLESSDSSANSTKKFWAFQNHWDKKNYLTPGELNYVGQIALPYEGNRPYSLKPHPTGSGQWLILGQTTGLINRAG